ncbi:nucleoside diphosphate kinase [Stylonychia lemnae]|uniref:Nucleoside diphosphate kinase n=1 Tax=Stylonychia lemnae TaxID=5949 RepID=A0A078BA39_STYLE|nr:nucleoside diphosphate kinase [Stylonychia lemnae]|eukprot:CDW91111.1 nucleoside diphosphate kinase [Stylonychia lemnae]
MAFIAEWYDKLACIEKPFRFIFYPIENALEIIDLKTKKLFLKKIKHDAITLQDLYIGNTLDVYGRRFKIVEFADQVTKEMLFSKKERTFAIIKPDAYTNIGKILDIILNNGFQINRMLMLRLNEEMVQLLYPEQALKAYFRELQRFLTSDLVVGLELVGDNSIERLKALAGSGNSYSLGTGQDRSTIRAIFGSDGLKNAIHVAQDEQRYKSEIDIFFNDKYKYCQPAILNNCSLLLIKPHVIQSGQAGRIIDRVLEEGFEISAMQTFFLDRATAEEFFELYKGVLPEYSLMIDQMVSGPTIALEVRQDNVIQGLKAVCGCYDPKVGLGKGEQNTLRQLFGIDRVRNAVHCTDVKEEGVLECEYFFVLMQERKTQ